MLEIERKFLVEPPDLTRPPLRGAAVREIEQRYLAPDDRGGSHRVRRVAEDGRVRYYETVKHDVGPASRQEDEREIDVGAYEALVATQLDGTRVIRKRRFVFDDGGLRWELDCFDDPPGLYLLEVELDDADRAVEPPAAVTIVRDVTDEPAYTNAVLAGVA